MGVEVDYYDVLGISRSASTDEITEAVKKQMRQWRKRTEAADLGVRQEAEVRVKHIEEARTILTNASQRQAYDAKLAREGVQQAVVPSGGGGSNWVEQARHFLSVGDYHSAAYAAREATQQAGNTAESWYLRSRANAGLDRYEDAWYEAQQATMIEGGNPEYHFNAGMVAEAMGRFDKAINEYKSASRLDSAPMYELAIGGVLLQQEKTKEAVELIGRVYNRVPDDENANYYYGMALLEAAEHVPALRDSESYVVTSAEEITQMRSLLEQVKKLRHQEADIKAGLANIENYLDSVEKKSFNRNALVNLLGATSGGGCMGVAIGILIPLLPLFLIMGGIGSFADGGVLWFFLGVIGLVIEYFVFWQPGWKINRAIHRGR